MYPRIIGIDFGLARVGIAMADPLQNFATPLGTFDRKQSLLKLVEIREQEGIELIVLGWPLRLDGTEGETVKLVRRFEHQIESALPGISIVRWDERFTSKIAERAVREAGGARSSRRRKERIDAAAAAVLLQSFLDARSDLPDQPGPDKQ